MIFRSDYPIIIYYNQAIMGISWVYHGLYNGYHGYIMGISWVYHGYIMDDIMGIMDISWVYHGYIMDDIMGYIMDYRRKFRSQTSDNMDR